MFVWPENLYASNADFLNGAQQGVQKATSVVLSKFFQKSVHGFGWFSVFAPGAQ
jgi:hypothetical protein